MRSTRPSPRTDTGGLTAARQEVLQAKYMSLLNIELLNIYQGRGTNAEY